jgi:hypothetical protein
MVLMMDFRLRFFEREDFIALLGTSFEPDAIAADTRCQLLSGCSGVPDRFCAI